MFCVILQEISVRKIIFFTFSPFEKTTTELFLNLLLQNPMKKRNNQYINKPKLEIKRMTSLFYKNRHCCKCTFDNF